MWRLRHIPTGFYWGESDGSVNTLSKSGTPFAKVWKAEEKKAEVPNVVSIHDTQAHRKNTAVEGWLKQEEGFNQTIYYTNLNDWEVVATQL